MHHIVTPGFVDRHCQRDDTAGGPQAERSDSPTSNVVIGIKIGHILIALVAEWLRVRLRVRMVRGSTLTVGNFLSLENLNVIIRAIN